MGTLRSRTIGTFRWPISGTFRVGAAGASDVTAGGGGSGARGVAFGTLAVGAGNGGLTSVGVL
jgi:hypothetical protein